MRVLFIIFVFNHFIYINMNMKEQSDKQLYLPLIYSNTGWQSDIKPILLKISKSSSPINTVKLLKLLYEKAYRLRYGPNQKIDNHSFKQLYSQYSETLQQLFSNLADYVSSFQKNKLQIKILYSQYSNEINIRKSEALLLMAMMALGITGIYSDRNQFPNVTNFGFIFSQEEFKTKTIIEYLKVEIKNHKEKLHRKQEILTLGRICQNRQLSSFIQQYGERQMIQPIVTNNEDCIQNYFGHLKVDFANMYIGGGALLGGQVQEEIMFANHPQMYISVLFCQVMSENEAIYFAGFKKYWKNSGYSYTTKFQGKQEANYNIDKNDRAAQYIVGIDAIHFYSKQGTEQFEQKYIDRQLLKCLVGFSYQIESDRVVTGNWGCGAFSGNVSLKFIIQWISCSILGKKLIYCPFGKKDELDYKFFINEITKLNVQKAYEMLINHSKYIKNGTQNIISLISSKLNFSNNQ